MDSKHNALRKSAAVTVNLSKLSCPNYSLPDAAYCGEAALISSSESGKSSRSSGTESEGSSSDSELLRLGDCVHLSRDFLAQHESALRAELMPVQKAIGCDLAGMGACCHLDQTIHQAMPHRNSHDILQLPVLPRHHRAGGVIAPAFRGTPVLAEKSKKIELETPSGPQVAAPDSSSKHPMVFEKRMHTRRSVLRFYRPNTNVERRSVLETEEERNRFLLRISRRIQRTFTMAVSDAIAVVEGIHERCGQDFGETKRICANLLSSGDQRSVSERRQEKRTKSLLKIPRQDRLSCTQAVLEGDSGVTGRSASVILMGDTMERQSKLLAKSRFSEVEDPLQVCCTEVDTAEIVRTQELEATIVSLKPPDFELVKTWVFSEAPVRQLRRSV